MFTEVTWYTWIYTSDVRGAGTDANVYLVVYGNKGKSDEVWLDNESNNFETAQTDNFKIEITDIGRPYKIRIGHDNSNPASAWHLDKVCRVITNFIVEFKIAWEPLDILCIIARKHNYATKYNAYLSYLMSRLT